MPQDPSLLFLSYLVLLLVTSTTSNRIDNSNSMNIFKSPQQPQDTKLLPPAAVSRQLDDAVVPSFPPWWEGELVNCTRLGSLHACLIPSQGILQCWNGVCPDPDYQCTFYNYPVLIEDILGRCCDLFGGISEMLESLTNDVLGELPCFNLFCKTTPPPTLYHYLANPFPPRQTRERYKWINFPPR